MSTEVKILSVNPGSIERLPSFSRPAEAPTSIVPPAERLARLFGGAKSCHLRGSASRLLLRIVASVFVIGGAVMQMRGELHLFGFEDYPYIYGIAALVLGICVCVGLAGRYSALLLTVSAVMSLSGYASAHGGVADFTAPNQLSLLSGMLTAVVAVLGTGQLTLWNLLRSLFRR